MIRIGIIGVGFMGRMHQNVLRQFPDVEVVAVADRSQAARDGSQTTAYEDFRELLKRERLDAVHICLPDNEHAEALQLACREVPNVFVEKPAGITVQEVDAAIRAAHAYGANVAVGHIVRHDVRYRKAYEDCEKGVIGSLCTMSFCRNSPVSGARKYRAYASLPLHVMIHDIDIANLFAKSAPMHVYAVRHVRERESDVPFEMMFATVSYQNGIVAQFEACWTLSETIPYPILDEAEWIGTDGYLRTQPCFEGYSSVGPARTGAEDLRYWPEIDGKIGGALRDELRAFIDGIRDGARRNATLTDARDAVEIALAVEESARLQRPVQMS